MAPWMNQGEALATRIEPLQDLMNSLDVHRAAEAS